MKRQIANKLKKFSMMFCALLISALALSGCSTLTYSGADYNAANVAPVQTNESFYFSTYNKTSDTEEIALRLGVSKTPVADILVVYAQINNNSNTNDYVFYTKDFLISAQGQEAQVLPPSNYLGAYQSSQAGSIAAMSQTAGTLGNIATIANNYQRLNQTSPAIENASGNPNDSAFKQISAVVEGISAHTINNAAVIKPKENKFFYIFVKDPGVYPITIKYKDLDYSFMVRGNAPNDDEE